MNTKNILSAQEAIRHNHVVQWVHTLLAWFPSALAFKQVWNASMGEFWPGAPHVGVRACMGLLFLVWMVSRVASSGLVRGVEKVVSLYLNDMALLNEGDHT